MIVRVTLERGLTPVAAAQCDGDEGRPARTVEEAVAQLNKLPTHLKYRMYGQGNARRLSLFGMLSHHDGFVQVVVDSPGIAEGCALARDLVIKRTNPLPPGTVALLGRTGS